MYQYIPVRMTVRFSYCLIPYCTCTYWYVPVCTNLPNPVQVYRIPDVSQYCALLRCANQNPVIRLRLPSPTVPARYTTALCCKFGKFATLGAHANAFAFWPIGPLPCLLSRWGGAGGRRGELDKPAGTLSGTDGFNLGWPSNATIESCSSCHIMAGTQVEGAHPREASSMVCCSSVLMPHRAGLVAELDRPCNEAALTLSAWTQPAWNPHHDPLPFPYPERMVPGRQTRMAAGRGPILRPCTVWWTRVESEVVRSPRW
jgi:hypothetical protein